MSEQTITTFWKVTSPSEWPKAPLWMSISTLIELEACPRRWALSEANYSHLWKHSGYPPRPQIASLEGTVVHLALEKISHALTEKGCYSLKEEGAYSTLKDLGGYTVILTNCIEYILRQYESNPRAVVILESVRQHLMSHCPKYRTRVQLFLSRIRLAPREIIMLDHSTQSIKGSKHLMYGSHAEVRLEVPEMGWRGIVDLFTLNSDCCEIRDFKTGVFKPQHEFQLRTYALLWIRDKILNPFGRFATKLVLSYDEHDIEIPVPKKDEIKSLENEIRQRTAMAISDLQNTPPEARPGKEVCPNCPVRQLCEEYWYWQNRQESERIVSEAQYADMQIKLLDRHGPFSWNGVVESSSILQIGQSILIRTNNTLFQLSPGQRIRILNIYIQSPKNGLNEDDSPPVVATMGINTEVFNITM